MSMSIANLTLDCENPELVAKFWSEAMDLPIDDGASEYFVSIGRTSKDISPNWFFMKVPEGKTVKNRLHLDLESSDESSDGERLVSLGATEIAKKEEWGHRWTIYNDPEGNEFCMSAPHVP